jgi:hypothetical protein
MNQNEKEKIIKDLNDETTDAGKHCKMIREHFSEYIRERYDLFNHMSRSAVSCIGFYEEFIVINTGVNKKLNPNQDCLYMEIYIATYYDFMKIKSAFVIDDVFKRVCCSERLETLNTTLIDEDSSFDQKMNKVDEFLGEIESVCDGEISETVEIIKDPEEVEGKFKPFKLPDEINLN